MAWHSFHITTRYKHGFGRWKKEMVVSKSMLGTEKTDPEIWTNKNQWKEDLRVLLN